MNFYLAYFTQFGRFNTLVPLAILQAVAVFAIWTTAMHVPQTLVFAVLYVLTSLPIHVRAL